MKLGYVAVGGAIVLLLGSVRSVVAAKYSGNLVEEVSEENSLPVMREVSLESPDDLTRPVNGENLPPCPHPKDKTTGVLIEGDTKPGEGRKEKIEAVVQENGLKGKWCISQKTGNPTWNMDGVSVDEAVRVFNLFKEAGLISIARPTNNPDEGRVRWSPAEAQGTTLPVSMEMPSEKEIKRQTSPCPRPPCKRRRK